MPTISDYLKAERIDPTLPRDSFVPPSHDDDHDDEVVDTEEHNTGDENVE